MAKAVANIGRSKYKTTLQIGRHSLIADEPETNGGADEGPAPGELLRMSLAACTAITLRMYADRKGWEVDNFSVEVDFDKTENGTLFHVQLSFDGNLDDSQRQRLVQIANACPVHKILAGNVDFQTVLKS